LGRTVPAETSPSRSVEVWTTAICVSIHAYVVFVLKVLSWGDEEHLAKLVPSSYDVVCGSDVLYPAIIQVCRSILFQANCPPVPDALCVPPLRRPLSIASSRAR
jgi:hypothetical protein